MKILITVLIYYSMIGSAENNLTNASVSETKIRISGTSTIRDWEMICDKSDGTAQFNISNNKLTAISQLKLYVRSKDLESGKTEMNNHAYKALKADNYPYILYNLTRLSSISFQSESFSCTATGVLNIAGESRTVSFPVNGKMKNDGIFFSGVTDLNMKDYNVDPPVLMWGTLKTAEMVKVSFSVFYKYTK